MTESGPTARDSANGHDAANVRDAANGHDSANGHDTVTTQRVAGSGPGAGGQGSPGDDASRRSWRWKRRFVRVRRWVRRSFGLLLLLAVGAIVLVAQTGRGQDLALRTVLDRVRTSLAGELTVESVRSGTLLTGATLRGVRLVAGDGRPFLAADSVVLRYSLLSLVTGGPPIRSTVLWGVDLEISQYDEDQEINLAGLIADDGEDDGQPGAAVGLGHIGIREGRARVLTPASPTTTPSRVVEGPEGQRLRELAFEQLDLDVEEAVVAPGAAVEFEARLASFTSDIAILDEPLRIREVFGVATFGDRGLWVSDAAFRLPETLVEGELIFGPAEPDAAWTLRTTLRSDGWGDLADLHWIEDRIPDGRFRGGATLAVDDGIDVTLDELAIELEASDVVLDGRAVFADQMVLRNMNVDASPLALERLEPWIGRPLPLDGWLSGQAEFSGTLDDLTTDGQVTLVPTGFDGDPVTARFSGTLLRGDDPGASSFEAQLEPLNYAILGAIWPELPLRGTGSATIALDGRVSSGFRVDADLLHASALSDTLASDVGVRGVIRRDGAEWRSDVDLELRPLALGALAEMAPDLALRGDVAGPVRIEGPASALSLSGDLDTEAGRLGFDGTVNVRDPGARYAVEFLADSLEPSGLSGRLPDRTVWSGAATLEGRGLSLDSADIVASVALRDSRYGSVRIDSLSASARISDGVLNADSLRATVGGVGLSGRGSIGLVEGRSGSSQIDFEAASVTGLRPLLLGVGDSVMVRDALTELDREFLRAQGIEPDTLPTAEDVRLEGAVQGTANLTGRVEDFDLGLILEVRDGRYQENAVDSARVGFTATSLPALTGAWQLGVSANGIVLGDRTFEQGGFEADMLDMSGDGRIEVVRREGEQYRAVGSFAVDSIGGFVDMREASITIGEDAWSLARPARVTWDSATIAVDSVEVDRLGTDPMHLLVDGTLTRGGESDFHVEVDGLHMERAVQVAQREDLRIQGHVDADLRVRGTASSPRIEGTFSVESPAYGDMALEQLEGSLDYGDRLADIEVEGFSGGRTVLTAQGTIPIDLALTQVEERLVSAPMSLTLQTDSLDAAIALSYVSALENVEGSVTGRLTVGGTPMAPEPEGLVTLTDAAWSVEAIGVRHTGIEGELRLRRDRIVDVELISDGTGRAEVSGTVLLEPVTDPVLDLHFTFDRFLSVSRADMEGTASGELLLGGSYTRPVVTGAVTVDAGTLYVDELRRSVGVVDLSDPFLFDVDLSIDTTALSAQPVASEFESPFFDNIRVDVDLSVPRNSWMRSIESNVELSGDLLVRYDRSAGDFVLIGELQAVRGSHLVLGRTFQLAGGTVSFIGRPGLNPDLDIQATTRIRSPDNPPLDVNAEVGGTLVRPVVTLTSDQAGLAEEDLVSYLVFGMPSSQLSGRGAASQSFLQGGSAFFFGAAANQLGSALAREVPIIPLDYLAVQGGIEGSGSTWGSGTRIEAGTYLNEDVFAVVVYRPIRTSDENPFPGVRVEWAMTDDYNLEGYLEDRFLRSSSSLAASAGLLDDTRIMGIFFFREWGYTPGRDR